MSSGNCNITTSSLTLDGLPHTLSNADTASAVIVFKNNNLFLDCNGSKISSANGLGRAVSSAYNNITVKNCIFDNYEYGISISSAHSNYFILNNYFNVSYQGIRNFNMINLTVINNTINQKGWIYSQGIYLVDVNYTNIAYNTIKGFEYGIMFDDSSAPNLNFNISNNVITNFNNSAILLNNGSGHYIANNLFANTTRPAYETGGGIQTDDPSHINNCFIFNNTIDNTGRHGIHYLGSNNNITYNTVSRVNHSGIGGSNSVIDEISGTNNIIAFNTITNVTYGAGIATRDQTGLLIYNNTLTNFATPTSTNIYGIDLYLNPGYTNLGANHRVYNNTCINVPRCIIAYQNNVSVESNYFNAYTTDIYLETNTYSAYNMVRYANNVFNGLAKIRNAGGTFINSTFYHNSIGDMINFTTLGTAYVNINYNGVKNYSILNNTITLNSCGGNNCSINFGNTTVVNNLGTFPYSFPVSSNQNVEVKISSASGGCDYPYEDMTLTQSTTLCAGSYNLNDSNKNGALILNTSNVNLSCQNNTYLIGNQNSGIGINLSSVNNLIVKNCNILNYTNGIKSFGTFSGTDSTNISLINNNFSYNFRDVYFQGTDNYIVNGNNFGHGNTSIPSQSVPYNAHSFASFGSQSTGIISNNYFNSYGTGSSAIVLDALNKFINITGNTILNYDRGITVQSSNNLIISNNYIENMTYDADFYMTGIMIYRSPTTASSSGYATENISLVNNTIVNAGSVGILVQGKTKNISIINNSIDLVSWTDKASGKYNLNGYGIQDAGDTACGIAIGAVFKSFITDSTESNADNYTKIHNYTSENIQINGNTFSPDVDCLLWMQANSTQYSTLTQDFSNYWFKKFNPQTSFIDDWYFFISNNADTLYRYCPNCIGEKNVTSNLWFGYGTTGLYSNRRYNYTISKNVERFVNVNQTTNYNLSLYNLTNNPQGYQYYSAFYSNSSSPFCTEASCGDIMNLTMESNNRTIVLSYLTSTKYINTIASSVNSVSYSTNTYSLTVVTNGNGNVNVSVSSIQGSTGNYIVYKNGVKQGYSTTSDYIISTEGTYTFSRYDNTPVTGQAGFLVTSGVMVMLILVFIYMINNMIKNEDYDLKTILGLILAAIIIVGILLNFLSYIT